MKHVGETDLFGLDGKVAILTGAAGYFGRTFADCLLSAGAKVILFDKDESLGELSDALKAKYGEEKVEAYQVDFYVEQDLRKTLQGAVNRNRSIDVLVNNAFEFSKNTGFNDSSGELENISREQWFKCFDSGLYWHALATQIAGPRMRAQRWGSIINMSSMYAVVSPDPALYRGKAMFNPPSYGAAKAGLLAFTRYVASFYGEFGVRCNAILAGAYPHVGLRSQSRVNDTDFLERLAERTVLGRVGKADDLRGVLLFLASDASSYVTGEGIHVDGGWTIR